MSLLFLTIKVIFILLIVLPLLLIVGLFCLIEEYIILNPLWIRKYVAKAIKYFPIRENLSSKEIKRIEIKRSSGGAANMVRRIDIWLFNQDKPVQLLFKKYLIFGSLFSFLGYFSGYYPPSKISTTERQNSERNALRCFHEMGIAVPKNLFTDQQRKISLFQFIEGTRIDKLLLEYQRNKKEQEILSLFHQYGVCLANIHKSNWSLIDGNPFNFIYNCHEKKIYFVDLELSTNSNYKSWDIANALNFIKTVCNTSHLFTEKAAKEVEEHFMNGYSSIISPETMKEINNYLKRLARYNLFKKYLPSIKNEG